MKKIITNSFLFTLIFVLINNAYATNNTIAFVEATGNCSYNFRDSSNYLTYTPTSYFWDFGDGKTTNTKHAVHSYNKNDNYTITHIVSDGTRSDTAIITTYIYCPENDKLAADIIFNIIDSISTTKVYFTANYAGRPILFKWKFGDGDSSTEKNPTHIYPTSSKDTHYNVSLQISDSFKTASFNELVPIRVYNSCRHKKAYFQWTKDDSSCTKLHFSNLSHYTFTNYQWSFGNTGTSTSKSPTYQFASEGYYIIKLVASSSSCSDSIIQKVRVTCRTCFGVEADIDLVVDSTNTSKAKLYNYSRGIIAGHYWNFGDGTTSTANAPTHVYTSPGNIVLTYIVSDTGTCKDTAYIKFTIDSLGNIKRGNLSFNLQVIDKTNNATSITNNEKINPKLLVYPNPASNLFYFKNLSSKIQAIHIFDVKGAEILTMNIDAMEQSSIDIQNWKSGLYIIVSNTGERLKLIVE